MIELSHVSKSFQNKTVLRDLNLSLCAGEITFILGTSGAGKSTLLNLIGGLDRPSGGTIRYQGKDIAEDLDAYRSYHVGFIFQSFNLIDGLSVRDNVVLGLDYAGLSDQITDVDQQLNSLHLTDLNQRAETLSGGEKQRAAIIRSVCKRSDIILADEPTGNLDSANAETVFRTIVSQKKDKYIVIVTHDQEMARKYGDRIITVSDGQIQSDEYLHPHQDAQPSPAGQNSSTKKRKTSWHAIGLLGRNSIRRQFSKVISTALVIALAISALAVVFSFRNTGNSVSNRVNVNYLENDLMQLYYPATKNVSYQQFPFSEDTLQKIRTDYAPKETVNIYCISENSWLFSHEGKSDPAVIKQVNLSPFFEERIMSYDIAGNFPGSSDEMILAENTANALYGSAEAAIGQTVQLNDNNGNSISYHVTGVNRTVNPFDQIYSIVSAESLKQFTEASLDNILNNRLSINRYFEDDQIGEGGFATYGGAYAPFSETTGTERLLCGKPISDEHEILVSSFVLPYVLSGFEIDANCSEEEIRSGKLPESSWKALSELEMSISHNGLFRVRICGVYEDDAIGFRGSDKLAQELHSIEPVLVELYASEEYPVGKVKQAVEENESYICYLQQENLKQAVNQQTSFYQWAIILVGVILIFVSVSLMGSFSKIAVLERKREVAIMKSLGATYKEVLYTLWHDSIFITLIAEIMAFVITGGIMLVLPMIDGLSFMPFRYPAVPLLVLGAGFSLFLCFYTLLRLQKLAKKMPAELLVQ